MASLNLMNQVVLFPSSSASLFFIIIICIWLLSEIFGLMIPNIKRRKTAKTEPKERISIFILFASIFISITLAYNFAGDHIAMLPSEVYYVGMIFIILGIILRQLSIHVLGRFFSGKVAIQEDHKIIDKGPYAYVRHPSYTGALLILIGIGLALQSWGATLIIIILFAIAYGYRIHVEEKALISQFGEEYIKYTKRTKRIIPYII